MRALVGRALPDWSVRIEPDLADQPRVAIVAPPAPSSAAR
jgi:hypothetical protein